MSWEFKTGHEQNFTKFKSNINRGKYYAPYPKANSEVETVYWLSIENI